MSSHEEKNAPRTEATGDNDAIPSASATGMPRIIHRHKEDRSDQEEIDEKDGSPPTELQASNDEDEELVAGDEQSKPPYPPTGSLTLAAFNPYSTVPLSRRLALISGSIFINLGLPFLNGVMLGFGEIFARVVVAPALGITGVGWAGDTARAVANWNWGRGRSTLPSQSGEKQFGQDQFGQQRKAGDFDDWSATPEAANFPSSHIEL